MNWKNKLIHENIQRKALSAKRYLVGYVRADKIALATYLKRGNDQGLTARFGLT